MNRQDMLITAGVSLATLAGGFWLGLRWGMKEANDRLSEAYDDLLRLESKKTKKFYEEKYREDLKRQLAEKKPPTETVHETIESAVPKVEVQNIEDVVKRPEPVKSNVFTPPAIPENIAQLFQNYSGRLEVPDAAEIRNELDTTAMVISEEEYRENESGFEQAELTYFAGDDVLADAEDEVAEDARRWIGHKLHQFGMKSHAPNTVFIQVPQYQFEFEIVRDESKFSEVKAGMASPGGDLE